MTDQVDEVAEKAVDDAVAGGSFAWSFGVVPPGAPFTQPPAPRVRATKVVTWFDAATQASRPLEIQGAHITGPLTLALKAAKVPLTLRRCWLDGGLDLDSGDLGSVSLIDCVVAPLPTGCAVTGRFVTIAGELDFTETTFRGRVALTNAAVPGGVSLARATVASVTDVEDTWAVDLTNAQTGDVDMEGATVTGGISVAGATVTGQINLRRATATAGKGRRSLWAQRTTVTESVLADAQPAGTATFEGTVELQGIDVGGHLNLQAVSIRSMASPPNPPAGGEGAHLARLNLAHASVTNVLRLVGLTVDEGGTIDLRHCSVGTLRRPEISGEETTLMIEGLTYTDIDDTGAPARQWIAQAKTVPPGAYLTLAEAAATHGRTTDELRAKVKASSTAARFPEKVLLGWISYGYRPYLVAAPLIVLACLCAVLVARAPDSAFAPARVGDATVQPSACDDTKLRCPHTTWYALDSVLPLDLGQVSTWRPARETEQGKQLDLVITINGLAAWVLAGVFVAAVGGRLNRT